MSNGVVSHVYSGIRERLNQILLVPRQSGTQSKRPRTTPFFKPVQSIYKSIFEIAIEFFEFFRTYIRLQFFSVLILSVIDVPLITESNDTFVSCSRNYKLIWLEIFGTLVSINELLFDQIFGIFD